jgi:hypothetical protein
VRNLIAAALIAITCTAAHAADDFSKADYAAADCVSAELSKHPKPPKSMSEFTKLDDAIFKKCVTGKHVSDEMKKMLGYMVRHEWPWGE